MNRTILLLLLSGFVLISQAQVSKRIQSLNEAAGVKYIISTDTDASGHVYEIVSPQSSADKPFKVSQESTSKIVDISAGGLMASLTGSDLTGITGLTITGTIDARDFKTIRDNMPQLSVLDFSGATVMAYTGSEGSNSGVSTDYPANEIPAYAFAFKTTSHMNFVLTKVVMPSTITSIGNYAFQYCSTMNSVNIPESVVTIGTGAFFDCTGLTSIFIPSLVSSIGDNAFLACICDITVDPGNLNYSGSDGILFNKDQSLLIKCPSNKTGDYIIPSTVINIGNLAFYSCRNLYSVTIPTSVTTLGSQAFSYCTELTSIFIPSTVITLSNSVFSGSLCAITVDANNPNYSSADGVLFNKNKSTLIQATTFLTGKYDIPLSVLTIGNWAFQDCWRLTEVTIPTSVRNILGYAFYSCNGLTTANLPVSVINIGSSAFYNCSGLTSIYANSPIPVPLTGIANVFYGVNKSTCTLYVPSGSAAAYAASNQWNDFTSVAETVTGVPGTISNAITVFPNPVTGSFQVNGLRDASNLTLTDLNGSILLSKQVSANELVSVSSLPKGMYILKINNDQGTNACKMMIK